MALPRKMKQNEEIITLVFLLPKGIRHLFKKV